MTTIPFGIYTISNEIVSNTNMNTQINTLSLAIEQLPISQKPRIEHKIIINPSDNYIQPNKYDSTSALLNRLFPEQNQGEKIIRQTRALLGNLVEHYTTEQIEQIMIQILYLSETWLDSYERKIFNGMTLNELLNMG